MFCVALTDKTIETSKLVESPGVGVLVAFKNDLEGVGDLLSDAVTGDWDGFASLDGLADLVGSGIGLGDKEASTDLLDVLEWVIVLVGDRVTDPLMDEAVFVEDGVGGIDFVGETDLAGPDLLGVGVRVLDGFGTHAKLTQVDSELQVPQVPLHPSDPHSLPKQSETQQSGELEVDVNVRTKRPASALSVYPPITIK